jgi:G6PDH family F420-dependent oxidoreductase
MTQFGYTLMTEQAGPQDLVHNARAAEDAGFDFAVMSDHYSPWLAEQGHSPYAWSVLGAVAQATGTLPLVTFVTCPIKRYHPAVVAQKAATVQLLSDGRLTLGLGSGENLNEHVTGGGWPPVNTRHEMFREALEIIRELFRGGYVNYRGTHYEVDSAKLWDLPETAPPLGVAVSGRPSCRLAGELGDAVVAVEPKPELLTMFDEHGGAGKPRYGQLPICWDPDRDTAVKRAHEQFRWFAGGWKVNAELPGPPAFDAATSFVRPEDVSARIACGPDVEEHVEKVRAYVDAGYDHVAVVQVGQDRQDEFHAWAQSELLPALRAL